MIKKLPFKASHLLIIGTILFLLVAYRFAFRNTVEAWQLNNTYQKQLAGANNLSVEPGYLLRKAANIDKVLDRYRTDTVAFRNIVVNKISVMAEKENVKLTELPSSDPIDHTNQMIIQKLVFRGGYFSLLKLIDQLHRSSETGITRSLIIKLPGREIQNESRQPLLEIYLQTTK